MLTSNTVLASQSLASTLPAGIARAENPLSDNHFIVTGDPMDLAPVDEIIWRVVQEEMEKARLAGKKLAILFGEVHTIPSHHMAQIGLIRRLILSKQSLPNDKSNHILVTVEYPLNILDKLYPEIEIKMNETETFDPRLSALVYRSRLHYKYSPVSLSMVFDQACQSGFPFRFIDAPEKKNFRLDLKHPAVQPYLRYWPNITEHLRRTLSDKESKNGIILRNHTMTDLAHEYMIKTQSEILLHIGGSDHLFKYEEKSLSCLFSELNYQVLPLFLDSGRYARYHTKKIWKHSKILIISGVDETAFNEAPQKKQIAHIRHLREAYSGEKCPFETPKLMTKRELIRREREILHEILRGTLQTPAP